MGCCWRRGRRGRGCGRGFVAAGGPFSSETMQRCPFHDSIGSPKLVRTSTDRRIILSFTWKKDDGHGVLEGRERLADISWEPSQRTFEARYTMPCTARDRNTRDGEDGSRNGRRRRRKPSIESGLRQRGRRESPGPLSLCLIGQGGWVAGQWEASWGPRILVTRNSKSRVHGGLALGHDRQRARSEDGDLTFRFGLQEDAVDPGFVPRRHDEEVHLQ